MNQNPYSPPREQPEQQSDSSSRPFEPSAETGPNDLSAQLEFACGALQAAFDASAGQHVGAQEVCRCALEIAFELNGDDAKLMLEDLELATSEDLGAAVYELISMGAARASKSDQPADFTGLYDIATDEKRWQVCWNHEPTDDN